MRERILPASGPKKRASVGHPPSSTIRRWRGGAPENHALIVARAFLPQDADPETFTHEELTELVQKIDRSAEAIGVYLTAKAIRNEMEWLLWDRDGWRDAENGRHERAA